MWLLEAKTRTLKSFIDVRQVEGQYAILSHTWAEDEYTFADVHERRAGARIDYRSKISYACRQAVQDGLQYVWVDTCCIDKRSSAELSEAINSMYSWYYRASICYVYLSDVVGNENTVDSEPHFRQSRWFTRGWTLQELIAPHSVRFYDKTWTPLGDKAGMIELLGEATGIDPLVLQDRTKLSSASVAQRMSWAANRSTSREEDVAYCLLGIFNVNMPLLYGEGEKAFQRLQEEIIRTSTSPDHSILLWDPWDRDEDASSLPPGDRQAANTVLYPSLLSPSPWGFRHGNDIVSWSLPQSQTFELSPSGLHISLYMHSKDSKGDRGEIVYRSTLRAIKFGQGPSVVLNCRYREAPEAQILLRLNERPRVTEWGHSRKTGDEKHEVLYDRVKTVWDRAETIRTRELIDTVKTKVTLAQKPFIYSGTGTKLQASVDNASCDDDNLYEFDMEDFCHFIETHQRSELNEFDLSINLSPSAPAPTHVGHLTMRYRNAASQSKLAVLSITTSPCERIFTRVPSLYMALLRSAEDIKSFRHEQFVSTGQTYCFTIDEDVFAITAHFVIMAGEMLWTLEIKAPAIPKALRRLRQAPQAATKAPPVPKTLRRLAATAT